MVALQKFNTSEFSMSAQQLPRKRFLRNLRNRVIGQEAAVTLVVGDIARWMADGRSVPDVRDVTYVEFENFSSQTLSNIRPDVVLSPLVTDSFDAFQVCEVLADYGFAGRYRAVAPSMPNLSMIRSEITTAAPDIDFDIVTMPPTLVSVD